MGRGAYEGAVTRQCVRELGATPVACCLNAIAPPLTYDFETLKSVNTS